MYIFFPKSGEFLHPFGEMSILRSPQDLLEFIKHVQKSARISRTDEMRNLVGVIG